MYPRAKFADGLAIIEKVGHSKRMQIMRKGWINDGKPKDIMDDVQAAPRAQEHNQPPADAVQRHTSDHVTAARTQTPDIDDWSDDGPFGPLEVPAKIQNASADNLFVSDDEVGDDALPEDELGALLAEDEMNAKTTKNMPQQEDNGNRQKPDVFEDEMEAMAGLNDIW